MKTTKDRSPNQGEIIPFPNQAAQSPDNEIPWSALFEVSMMAEPRGDAEDFLSDLAVSLWLFRKQEQPFSKTA